MWNQLSSEFEETSTLLENGVEQLNEIAEVMIRLRSEHDKLSLQLMHENEKADLLYNILGSLLQEVSLPRPAGSGVTPSCSPHRLAKLCFPVTE